MNLDVLKRYGIVAKKSLGQNFLVDENILNIISSSIDVKGNNILEIGPGFGALTEKLLLKTPKSLHLVELDKDMVELLNKRIDIGELKINGSNFQIFNQDVLKFEPKFIATLIKGERDFGKKYQGDFVTGNYYLIANIPYYITSPILYRFLYDVENKPVKMIILMQKDVGDKIIEGQILKKGKIRSSVLSLFIAKKAYVMEIIKVPASSFIPAPKVESSVLSFELHDKFSEIDDVRFLEFIKIGFQEPRKKLVNNLVKGGYEKEKVISNLKDLGFDENVRGEGLSIDNWIGLLNHFEK